LPPLFSPLHAAAFAIYYRFFILRRHEDMMPSHAVAYAILFDATAAPAAERRMLLLDAD